MPARRLLSFPDPVNETSARLVAGGVVLEAAAFLVFGEWWILVLMVCGFAARVATGPTLSPLGQLATRVGTPLLERRLGVASRLVPGPPKRFAQVIGLVVSGGALLATSLGATALASTLVALLVVAASLEAFFGVCVGCIAYQAIWGCPDCSDVSERLRAAIDRAQEPAPEALARGNE